MGCYDGIAKKELDVTAMDIDKELETIWDDPLLDLSQKELGLFDFPSDMKKVMESRNKADYVAQRKL